MFLWDSGILYMQKALFISFSYLSVATSPLPKTYPNPPINLRFYVQSLSSQPSGFIELIRSNKLSNLYHKIKLLFNKGTLSRRYFVFYKSCVLKQLKKVEKIQKCSATGFNICYLPQLELVLPNQPEEEEPSSIELYSMQNVQYSKMGNQNCYITPSTRGSLALKIPSKHEICNSPETQNRDPGILSENASDEIDQSSPFAKFDIRFLSTSFKASKNKQAQKSQVSQKNRQCMAKRMSSKFGPSKLEVKLSQRLKQGNLVGLKDVSKYLMQQNSPNFDLKILGENFYKIRQEPINPYYQIIKKIGEGSFGSVYKGKCLITGDARAIKILKKKIMNESDQKSLISQINVLKKMDHINIIKLYDVFFYKNFFYVVTQFCEGGSLLEALQKQQIKSQKDVMLLMKQIVSAVSYMHQMKIAHRDLKLDNIVLVKELGKESSAKACVKLIDFGLAQEVQSSLKNKTGLVGTISYMAPQIFSGFFSTLSDVWSCGIILCMLLIGFNPFKRKKQTFTISAIQGEEINFNEREWHRVSPKAKSLVVQMLEKSLEKRINMQKVLSNQWFKSLITAKQKADPELNVEKSEIVISNFNSYHRGNNFICYVKNFLISRQMTQSTRQEMALIFQKIDSDSSGVIEKQELIELYSLVSGNTNVEIQKLVEKIDQNKSGRIDFHEFLVCMTKNEMIRNQSCIREAFQFFDEDKTGYIERDELFECLDGCQQQQVVKILKVADFNGDGKISRNQFLEYLTNVQI